MPWPVYSERFVGSVDGGHWTQFVVPAGQRAIVKSVSASNWGPSISRVHVQAGGIYVFIADFPAAIAAKAIDVMAVAYAGEAVALYIDGPQCHAQVSGWLLEDGSARATELPVTGDPPLPDPPAYLEHPELVQ